jgi:hypothetical protein
VAKIDGACSMHGRNKKYIKVFGQKIEGKRLHGRYRHSWEDGIKMDLG